MRVRDVQREKLREREYYRAEGEAPCPARVEALDEEVGADAAEEAAEEAEYGEDGHVHCLALGDERSRDGGVVVAP